MIKYIHPRRMPAFSETLYFQVTDICNANCVFCGYQHYRPRLNRTMSMDVFEKGVRQHAELGGKNICISAIVGEPLVDPNLFEKIEIARRLGVPVGIFTNGILLGNMGNIEKILGCDNIFRLCISTAGFECRMFERVMRSKKYDAFVNGVERLLRENNKRENPIDIRISLRPDKSVSDAMRDPDMVERILPHLPRENIERTIAFDNWCGTITQEDLTGNMLLAKPIRWRRKPCMSLFQPMLTVDGKVRACACRFARSWDDELIIGDLNSSNLAEILPRTKGLVRRFYEGDIPEPCKNCSAYEPARPLEKSLEE